jgi:hypothetical protein
VEDPCTAEDEADPVSDPNALLLVVAPAPSGREFEFSTIYFSFDELADCSRVIAARESRRARSSRSEGGRFRQI